MEKLLVHVKIWDALDKKLNLMFTVIGRKRKNRRDMSPENSLLPRDSNVRSRNRVGTELVLPVAVTCIACVCMSLS